MMQKLLAAAGICLMALAGPAAASTQTVITFDDVNWDMAEPIPGQYGGVDEWQGAMPWIYGNGAADTGAYGDAAIWVYFSSPVVFVGANYASFGYNGHDFMGGYELRLQGQTVFQEMFTAANPVPAPGDGHDLTWLNSGYSGPVDSVFFFGPDNMAGPMMLSSLQLPSGEGVLIDNLTYAAAPVPEPGSVAMVLAGLGLVGGLARRRQAKD